MTRTGQYFMLAVFSLVFSVCANATVINAASTAVSAVQTAVNTANAGDVVVVPAGSAVWSTTLQITKGIELRGAGIGKTMITNPATAWQVAVIHITGVVGQKVDINGFSFVGSLGDADTIVMSGSTRAFRIHHNEFKNGGAHSIWMWGDLYGVIDHNKFTNPSREVISIFDKATGDDSWNRPLSLGTAEAVYAEDNDFQFLTLGDHAITGINGTRYVFRHNIVNSTASLNSSQLDAHGNYEVDRGTRSFEIYENVLSSGSSYQGMYMRGGTGVIFNNKRTGSYYHPIIFTDYRSFNAPYATYVAPDQIRGTYAWGNTYNGASIAPWVDDRGSVRTNIQLNRDYFVTAMPGYTPYAYPHPLVGVSGTPSNGPSAPSNLRAVH